MNPSTLLATIPPGLRTPLIEAFTEICRNYAERRWEPSELNGGKLCEIVYAVLDGTLSGNYASTPSKPSNIVMAFRALEGQPANSAQVGNRSLRILIPRMLISLYEIRNNRGVGHAGGDVNPNFMDATVVQAVARWVIAELIRVFHQVSTAEAQQAVDALVERRLPIIWEKEGIKRVLIPELDFREQTLLLLYTDSDWVAIGDLIAWTEYSSISAYRRNVLARLHKERLAEFEVKRDRACITTAGIHYVEDRVIPSLEPAFS